MCRSKANRGSMLVEVMVTVALVALLGITVLSGLVFGVVSQQKIHEMNGATRVAAERIESLRRIPVWRLETVLGEEVTIYDNTTTDNTEDDTKGELDVRLYRVSFNEDGEMEETLVEEGETIPEDELPLLRAEVQITWTPAGRKDIRTETVTVETLLAP